MIHSRGIIFISVCLLGLLLAQVEEIPALRSKQETQPMIEEDKTSEALESNEDSGFSGRDPFSEEETEQMRSFITVNFMIIIIVVLIVALVFFVIVRRVRKSKRQ